MSRTRPHRERSPGLQTRLLFKQLQLARSPAARFQVAMKALHLVRELNPAERLTMLSHLGLEEGAKLLRRLSPEEGDQIANVLMHQIEVLEERPDKARQLLADLKDPKRRRDALARGLTAISTLLTLEPSEAEDAEPEVVEAVALVGREGGLEGALPDAAPVAEEGPSTAAREDRAATLQPPPALPSTLPPSPPASTISADLLLPVAAPLAPAELAGSTVALDRDPLGGRHPVTAQPTTTASANLAGEPPGDAVDPRPASSSAADTALDQLRGEDRLGRRLALLGELANGLSDTDLEGLVAVLACLPDGWARRRALERLLAAGAPAAAADAPELVARTLSQPVHRLFAFTALVACRPLEEEVRRRCLEALPPGALRRRLALRFRRAPPVR